MTNPKNVVNLLALILKQLIYICKYQGEEITYARYIQEINLVERMEYYNARKNNTVQYHAEKWSNPKNGCEQSTNDNEENFDNYVQKYIEKM